MARRLRAALLTVLGSLTLFACQQQPQILDDSVTELSLKTLNGEPFVVAEPASALFVNFWSTDCAICVAEMPELARLYEEYHPRGLRLVAVAMPYDPPNHVLEMAESRDFPFPVALDLRGEAVAAFGDIQGTPTSFLLDSQGRLVQRYIGAIPFKALRRELDQLSEAG